MASIIRRGVAILVKRAFVFVTTRLYGGDTWIYPLYYNGDQIGWLFTTYYKDGTISHCEEIWNEETQDFDMIRNNCGGFSEKAEKNMALMRRVAKAIEG